MNLLLLDGTELIDAGLALVKLSRYPARAGWWPPPPGRRMRVGLVNGRIGSGVVERLEQESACIRFSLQQEPPPPLPLTLLLALSRPKAMRRMLRAATEMGVKSIILLNSAGVEKSYWQSPLLAPGRLRETLREGLEQACDTLMPRIGLRPRFRPFVEDELPALAAGSDLLLAQPGAAATHGVQARGPTTLAIGPEAGFSNFEIALLEAAGFRAVSFGPRILRSETAVPAIIAALFPVQGLGLPGSGPDTSQESRPE